MAYREKYHIYIYLAYIYLAAFKRRGKTTLSHSKRGIKPVFKTIESSVRIAIRFSQARFNTVYELGQTVLKRVTYTSTTLMWSVFSAACELLQTVLKRVTHTLNSWIRLVFSAAYDLLQTGLKRVT